MFSFQAARFFIFCLNDSLVSTGFCDWNLNPCKKLVLYQALFLLSCRFRDRLVRRSQKVNKEVFLVNILKKLIPLHKYRELALSEIENPSISNISHKFDKPIVQFRSKVQF